MSRTSAGIGHLPPGELVRRIAEDIAAAAFALEHGDPELSNAYVDRKNIFYKELRSRGQQGRDALLTLLDHPNPYVRCTAAGHALEFAPVRAEAVLESLRDLHGGVGAEAYLILWAWQKGDLDFSWLDKV